jgi:hypothetical protein
LQDWFLRYELKTVPGVAEVASIGGMVKQYQVVLDPDKLAAYGVTAEEVAEALQARQPGNRRFGASSWPSAEYMVRASGYLKTLDDFPRHADPHRAAACRCAGRCRHRPARPGDAARHRRTQRRGRSRRRRDRHALRARTRAK